LKAWFRLWDDSKFALKWFEFVRRDRTDSIEKNQDTSRPDCYAGGKQKNVISISGSEFFARNQGDQDSKPCNAHRQNIPKECIVSIQSLTSSPTEPRQSEQPNVQTKREKRFCQSPLVPDGTASLPELSLEDLCPSRRFLTGCLNLLTRYGLDSAPNRISRLRIQLETSILRSPRRTETRRATGP